MGRVVCAIGVLAATGAVPIACSLPLSGLGPVADAGAAAPDGSTSSDDGSVPAESGADTLAPDGGDAPGADSSDGNGPLPGAITSVGSVANATGFATQTHVVYATHAALWWLFWIDSTQGQTLQTSYSPDFVQWTQGASLPLALSHDGQGGNFSVAYADIGGTDVVHLTIGAHGTQGPNDQHHLHVRASINGSTVTFGGIDDMSDINDPLTSDPDGPATFVDSHGNVWDASGWASFQGTGNEVAWPSVSADQGSSWPSGFGAQQGIFVAQGTTHARSFAVAGGGAGALVALWDFADHTPPTNVGWAQYTGGTWTVPGAVFPLGSTQDPNDWDVGTLTDGHMHVVRRTLSGSFDHIRYDGTQWTTLAAPPVDPLGTITGSGVVILVSGVRLAVITVAADPANSVRQIVWNQTAWGEWTTIEGSTASRGYVSGWSGAKNDAVVWTEGSGGNHTIAGRIVSF
jgi:hypothetical protein